MKDFYVNMVEGKKRGNTELFNEVVVNYFGKELSWEEFKEQKKEDITKVMFLLDKAILLKKTPIHIEKLTHAIQSSRSGVGGQAMTRFKCEFCEKEETWGNTNTPGICKSCAKSMAEKIALYHHNILKDEVEILFN